MKSDGGWELKYKQSTSRKDSRRLDKKAYIKSGSYLDSETTPRMTFIFKAFSPPNFLNFYINRLAYGLISQALDSQQVFEPPYKFDVAQ